jgi:hypothetical protein
LAAGPRRGATFISDMSNQTIQERGHLYRYVSFERAVDIFQNNRLFFARPREWPDPYEVQLAHRGSDMLFAQCWCRTAISDAMWRLYSPGESGVRIGVRREKLAAAVGAWAQANGFGFREREVVYKPAAAVRERARALGRSLNKRFDLERATDALFLKREAYEHENEWRFVLYGEGVPAKANGLSVPVDALRLVDSVLLDPRASPELVAKRAEFFARELGYRKKVEASALDRPPDPIVVD